MIIKTNSYLSSYVFLKLFTLLICHSNSRHSENNITCFNINGIVCHMY